MDWAYSPLVTALAFPRQRSRLISVDNLFWRLISKTKTLVFVLLDRYIDRWIEIVFTPNIAVALYTVYCRNEDILS